VCILCERGGRTGQPSSKREAVTLLPSMNLSSLLLTSSSHPSERLNTYLTGDAVILFPWMNFLFFASIVLYWTCYPSLMVACLLRSHSSFFFCGRSCNPPFLSKSCHPFPWMTISALFLFTLFEGNLRESSLSAEDVTQAAHTMG
jgi:hypothetical protein